MKLDSKTPQGPLAEKWDNHKFNIKLVNPANKRKFKVIVVGTGLAGASAAASLAVLTWRSVSWCYCCAQRESLRRTYLYLYLSKLKVHCVAAEALETHHSWHKKRTILTGRH